MADFERFGGGVKARQADSEHVEVAKTDDNSAVLDEDDLEALAAVDDNAIIVGNDVVADPSNHGLITLREVSGDHIVTIGQHDDVPQMREMLQTPEPEVVLVSDLGAEVHITDFDAVEITTEHGGMMAEMKAKFDNDVRHPDSPRKGNEQGDADLYDRNWYFTEVRKP